MSMNVALQLHGAPDYELRICVDCGHTNVRTHNPNRVGELPCVGCGRTSFALYDPTWTPRAWRDRHWIVTDTGERYLLEEAAG